MKFPNKNSKVMTVFYSLSFKKWKTTDFFFQNIFFNFKIYPEEI